MAAAAAAAAANSLFNFVHWSCDSGRLCNRLPPPRRIGIRCKVRGRPISSFCCTPGLFLPRSVSLSLFLLLFHLLSIRCAGRILRPTRGTVAHRRRLLRQRRIHIFHCCLLADCDRRRGHRPPPDNDVNNEGLDALTLSTLRPQHNRTSPQLQRL